MEGTAKRIFVKAYGFEEFLYQSKLMVMTNLTKMTRDDITLCSVANLSNELEPGIIMHGICLTK